MNALDAARTCLAKLPSAISGAGGHPATFRAACAIVRFGLGDSDALGLLRDWNGTHCQPPWSEKELAHKLADARRKAGGQVRPFRQAPPAVRIVWKIQRKTPTEPLAQAPVQVPVEPLPLPVDPLKHWTVKPGERIPLALLDVLATWPAFAEHPAWLGQTQIAAFNATKTRHRHPEIT